MKLPDKLRGNLRDLPDEPGCYMMRDRRGKIIYVGKAVSLRKRVRSYFRQATLRGGNPKLRGLIKSTCDLDYLTVRNEAEAVLTEGRLIKEYKPRYNVSFKDDKRFLLLRARASETFPRFKLVRIRRDDGALYFGPYVSSQAARATLDFVEKRFGLRKCAPAIPDAESYRHCLNDIIRYCCAPCIGKAGPQEYRERFDEACAFLTGARPEYLKEIREEMEKASAAKEFERAGALRDTLFHLTATVKQRARIAPTPEMEKADALAGVEDLRKILNLKRPPLAIEAYDISNISGTYAVASMVCAVEGMPRRNRYRRFRIRTVAGADDPAMMAEVIRRRFERLRADGTSPPDLVLVDGGIAQLRAARRELAKLGFTSIASAGLAKRLEEIYLPEAGPPLRLPADSRALKVLQRIRDEAHRFALTYHRRLRGARIRESSLDEIPGIGAKKKQVLLAHFRSVRRLALATPEQIACAPGIGRRTAELIHASLQRRET
jgi:excinuclease ABC subunit C